MCPGTIYMIFHMSMLCARTHIVLHVNVGVDGDQVLDDLAMAILTTGVQAALTQLENKS